MRSALLTCVFAVRQLITRWAAISSLRRYAYLVIAVVAMALPGTDAISMLLEMVPLIVLFEVSVVLARVLGTTSQADPHSELAAAASR